MNAPLSHRIAVYTGTFDPVHRGHLDIIGRGSLIFDRIIVGVGWNSVLDSRNFSRVDLRLKPHAGRWESGSLNVGGILALGASLELLLAAGIDNLSARVLELTDYLCERAERAGVAVYSSRRMNEKSAIVSLVVPGDVRTFVRRCRDAGIVVNQRAGRLRVSPHAYNNREELDRLIALLGAIS